MRNYFTLNVRFNVFCIGYYADEEEVVPQKLKKSEAKPSKEVVHVKKIRYCIQLLIFRL